MASLLGPAGTGRDGTRCAATGWRWATGFSVWGMAGSNGSGATAMANAPGYGAPAARATPARPPHRTTQAASQVAQKTKGHGSGPRWEPTSVPFDAELMPIGT